MSTDDLAAAIAALPDRTVANLERLAFRMAATDTHLVAVWHALGLAAAADLERRTAETAALDAAYGDPVTELATIEERERSARGARIGPQDGP